MLGLDAFLAIAGRGSICGAAVELQVQPSTVSHQLKALEDRIGVKLFARTTRSVSLTDAGRVLHRSAMPAFEQLKQAVEQAQKAHGVLRGDLRINMPYIAYQIALAERLSDFQVIYPEIGLDFTMSDQLTDIVAEGFHAGIRFGDRVQQDMIAVQISPPNMATAFASPAYLDTHGEPKTPADLNAGHRLADHTRRPCARRARYHSRAEHIRPGPCRKRHAGPHPEAFRPHLPAALPLLRPREPKQRNPARLHSILSMEGNAAIAALSTEYIRATKPASVRNSGKSRHWPSDSQIAILTHYGQSSDFG